MRPNRYIIVFLSFGLLAGGLFAQDSEKPVTVPDGGTLLIGGSKLSDQATSKPGDKPLILVKPEIVIQNSLPAWQKANERGELPGPDGQAVIFWSEHCTQRGRLLALREAKKRATAQLAAQLLALKVAGQLTVGDFLAASDKPDVDINTFLLGADEKAVRYFPAAPVLETRMQISAISAVTSFKGWADRHVKGEWAEKLASVLKYIESEKARKLTLTAEALAAVPAKYCKKLPAESAAAGEMIRDLPAALTGPVTLSTAEPKPKPVSIPDGGKLLTGGSKLEDQRDPSASAPAPPDKLPVLNPATAASQPASGPAPVKTLKDILTTTFLAGERSLLSLSELAKVDGVFKTELDKVLKAAKPVKKGGDLKTFDFRPLWRYLCANPELLK